MQIIKCLWIFCAILKDVSLQSCGDPSPSDSAGMREDYMVEELDNLKRKCRNFLQVALEDFHHKLEDYMLEAIEKVERRCVQSWESSSKFAANLPVLCTWREDVRRPAKGIPLCAPSSPSFARPEPARIGFNSSCSASIWPAFYVCLNTEVLVPFRRWDYRWNQGIARRRREIKRRKSRIEGRMMGREGAGKLGNYRLGEGRRGERGGEQIK